jgi:predicted permease
MKFPWRRQDKHEELEQELQSHLQMAASDRIERGESTEKAQQAAGREFGNVSLVQQITRDQWGSLWLEEFLQDLRYGARMLRKNPAFTLVAILTLALGIGANTAIFSVVNGVLLNPLPYPHPEQLVTLHESKPNFEFGSISYPNFRDWQRDNHTFSSVAISRSYAFSLTGIGEAEQVRGRFISSDFFPTVGVNPVLGRNFGPGEDEIGAAPIALISAGLWKRKFGSSPDVLGKSITLDGRGYTVVGVVPANFDLLLRNFQVAEIYVPIGQWNNPLLPKRGAGLGVHGIARLKPGVSIEQARADMSEVTRNLAAAFPDDNKGVAATLRPLRQDMLGDVQPILLVLFVAVAFVLLIACVNVANLLLARSTGRTREFAIRTALGAGQGRVIRQLLTESILLALVGGALGLALASWGTQAALKHLPAGLPRAAAIGLDARVLIFTAAVSLLAGILFGLAPALKTRTPELHKTLKEGGRGASNARHGAQAVFVVVEMAMALVLLIGAGLMIRTMARLWTVNPGFRPENVLTFSVSLPPSMITARPDAIRAAVRELDAKIAATPGVQSMSETWGAVPLGSDDEQLFWLDGQPQPASQNEMSWTIDYIVEPGYLRTMGIPLQRGRFFTAQDNEHAPLVVVIDDVFARKYFGNQDPIGKRIVLNNHRSVRVQDESDGRAEIVGVVGHVNQWGLDSDDTHQLRAELYIPCMQMPDAFFSLVPNGISVMVRAANSTAGLLDSIRDTSRQMSSQQVIYGAQTMDEIISGSLGARRFSMILLGIFAAFALLLSSVGIYGVISYLVGQRTQEIGIRVALGARRWDVLRLVLGHSVKMAVLGVFIGFAASFALTRLMDKMLYGVSATDPVTFLAVAVILMSVALAASYIPARRAMRVDPIIALRYE